MLDISILSSTYSNFNSATQHKQELEEHRTAEFDEYSDPILIETDIHYKESVFYSCNDERKKCKKYWFLKFD